MASLLKHQPGILPERFTPIPARPQPPVSNDWRHANADICIFSLLQLDEAIHLHRGPAFLPCPGASAAHDKWFQATVKYAAIDVSSHPLEILTYLFLLCMFRFLRYGDTQTAGCCLYEARSDSFSGLLRRRRLAMTDRHGSTIVIASARAVRARGNPGQAASMNWTPAFAGLTNTSVCP